ncbi:ABC-2 type transporter OS=Tsukamurella paurometabola (strain ATCC 8368 / DSM / CCUG 35730 /CIP 100753 / JCM 10117 / KCTC 9821 / NBRC 16120 / NCIMB 702349/ NCTC 13040) OX=521096 GN=Tpau_4328 PE=4 SV=1 [Tsukamurella paurometabola]|uniref:ABC-2 type transporter n=1 Tax=Tsukamurella paurometabola (strain ATCC 8368 / DSM 20162 / CCUG 35730 / CIP 100753 / JCM 10117 / KCTC 9821 / NBRC 16120 / NCIMB 702349 / NCTC 13040) TaxID=521096 RepID=D5UZ42_TSUPD|nr:ABC transporter permease [Tsukamurella paurometabola]ADG80889.1 ABC-2 type transporter [Tsukamurella paurometabola DSM 20162]SUQ39255.1 Doxorubicin resistance ABC transporter permease protein drrB [Tsukamurella paurometabola]
MSIVEHPRTSVPLLRATRVLAARGVRGGVREGDLVFAIAAPVLFFLCFYTPLHRSFEAAGGDYAQYLAPVITLQAGLFTAIVAGQRAGQDRATAATERLATLPVPRVAPTLARLLAIGARAAITIATATAIAAVFGFRLHGLVPAVGYFALVLVVTLALSALADALGSVTAAPERIGELLMLPQVVLVMASTGLVPAAAFPEWIQPVVRNQPVSVFADALRGLADGDSGDPTAALIWAAALVVVGALACVLVARKDARR